MPTPFILTLIALLFTLNPLVFAQDEPTDVQTCPVVPADPELSQPDTLADYGTAIGAYLSGGGDPLALSAILEAQGVIQAATEDMPATGSIEVVDVTGDGFSDVLVSIWRTPSDEMPNPQTDVWFYACTDDRFELADSFTFPTPGFSPMPKLMRAVEVTGESPAEVLFDDVQCGAHTCFSQLNFYTWDGSALVPLSEQSPAFPFGDYTFGTEADGSVILMVEPGFIGSVGAGPQRQSRAIYRWDGESMVMESQTFAEPEYLFQAAHDGTTALSAEDYDSAIESYGRVLNDDSLESFALFDDNIQRADDIVTSHAVYGQLVVFAARDGLDAATTSDAYDRLLMLPAIPNIEESAEAVNLWQRYGQIFYNTALTEDDLSAACDAVLADIEATGTTEYESLMQPMYWPDFGYANFPPEPEAACPF